MTIAKRSKSPAQFRQIRLPLHLNYTNIMTFSKLGLPTALVDALADHGYEQPYPIQAKAIPAILKNKDLLGIAKTGSGKTASFVLPILVNLQKYPTPVNRQPQVLVVVPTRELAIQVGEVFQLFSKALPNYIKTMTVYGGVSINPQMMKMNGVQVLIATPGRLLDLIDSKALQLSSVKTLVLDEADKMLNLGFKEEMNRILSMLPDKRQNLLFSATLSPDLDGLRTILMSDPITINLSVEQKINVDLIEQSSYLVPDEKKGPLLRYLAKSNAYSQILVFASSGYKADNIADKLRKNGVKASAIHGKKSQSARKTALQEFKEGTLPVLVATDLLSRGIDIDALPCVVNYELPRSPKDYIHRIGRTGRAENAGVAISFVSPEALTHFKMILKKNNLWMEMIDSNVLDLHGY